jgi:hypothetical protein
LKPGRLTLSPGCGSCGSAPDLRKGWAFRQPSLSYSRSREGCAFLPPPGDRRLRQTILSSPTRRGLSSATCLSPAPPSTSGTLLPGHQLCPEGGDVGEKGEAPGTTRSVQRAAGHALQDLAPKRQKAIGGCGGEELGPIRVDCGGRGVASAREVVLRPCGKAKPFRKAGGRATPLKHVSGLAGRPHIRCNRVHGREGAICR